MRSWFNTKSINYNAFNQPESSIQKMEGLKSWSNSAKVHFGSQMIYNCDKHAPLSKETTQEKITLDSFKRYHTSLAVKEQTLVQSEMSCGILTQPHIKKKTQGLVLITSKIQTFLFYLCRKQFKLCFCEGQISHLGCSVMCWLCKTWALVLEL